MPPWTRQLGDPTEPLGWGYWGRLRRPPVNLAIWPQHNQAQSTPSAQSTPITPQITPPAHLTYPHFTPLLYSATGLHVKADVKSLRATVIKHHFYPPCSSYLQLRRNRQGPHFTYEIIIVDDGSKDGTVRRGHGREAESGDESGDVCSVEACLLAIRSRLKSRSRVHRRPTRYSQGRLAVRQETRI